MCDFLIFIARRLKLGRKNLGHVGNGDTSRFSKVVYVRRCEADIELTLADSNRPGDAQPPSQASPPSSGVGRFADLPGF
jgi:hypothetical protein